MAGKIRLCASLVALSACFPCSAVGPRELPCDLFAKGGTPCVAAHAMTRALFASYGGALYNVKRSSDGATFDVPVVAPGGIADAASGLPG